MTLLEFDSVKDIISGDIYFGGGESEAMSFQAGVWETMKILILLLPLTLSTMHLF